MKNPQAWQITFGGHTWTDEDALVGNAVAVNAVLGIDGWDAVTPWSSPTALAAWVTVLVASATGEDLDACSVLVNQTKLNELLGALTEPADEEATTD